MGGLRTNNFLGNRPGLIQLIVRVYKLAIFFVGLAILSHCGKHKQDSLIIAAAANLRPVMPELLGLYNSVRSLHPDPLGGQQPKLIYGSSGKLAAQIKNGAPFHVFVSADKFYPAQLAAEGLTTQPKTYGFGRLVLWVSGRLAPLSTPHKPLPAAVVRQIAVPNPALAPYGQAAIDWLRKAGHWPAIHPKIVTAENVSTAANYIRSQSVDAGFTARSLVSRRDLQNLKPSIEGRWYLLPQDFHRPIAQTAVRLKESGPAARLFLQTILSEEAGKILKGHGYTVGGDSDS